MANNPKLLKMPLARDGQKSTIPETTDASTGLFSQQYGWQSINSLPPQAGGKAVKREDFNGAFNLLGGIAFMAQKGFTFKWSAEQDYYAGCVVIDDTDSLRYECIADVTANSTAPSADATHWQIFKAGTDIDAWFRQASTVYAVGDMRCYGSLPYGWYLECTTAGTTGSGDITIPSPLTEKDTATDGTVVWTVRKIGSGGDGVPLGAILPLAHNSTIPVGYLLCDGSAVSRTMFPDLFAAIGTTYGAGDGSTTFNLPDYNAAKRFAQGDTVAGTVKNAGLPNITGHIASTIYSIGNNDLSSTSQSGALKGEDFTKRAASDASQNNIYMSKISFDASLSNGIYGNSGTVQPNALTARYIIKAFDDQTADSALIDITQYANELATKANRALDNLSADGENHFLEKDFMIIYPNGGTAESPASVTKDTRYVETNPFPGYRVKCEAEVLINNQWGISGFIYDRGYDGGFGTRASQLDDGDIVIQTGSIAVITNSNCSGAPFPNFKGSPASAPCRVKVWKIGKIPT